MSDESAFVDARREWSCGLNRAAGGAGTFGVCEIVVPAGLRVLLRGVSCSRDARIIVSSATSITAGLSAQPISSWNPASVLGGCSNGLRADAGILGMNLVTPNIWVFLDWVIDPGQRVSFISQTENVTFFVNAYGKLMPTSFNTDARMST